MPFNSLSARSLSLGLVTALIVSACSTPSQNNTNSNTLSAQDTTVSQASKPNFNFMPNEISSDVQPYQSLVIGDGFSTKSTVNYGDRAVIVKDPLSATATYVLSKGFMDKLRLVKAGVVAPAEPAIFTPEHFKRLIAPQSAVVIPASGPFLGPFTSIYTLTASELAFVTYIKKFNALSIPNYFDTTADASIASLNGTTPPTASMDFNVIINLTGVDAQFYRDINGALVNEAAPQVANPLNGTLTSDHILTNAAIGTALPATGLYALAAAGSTVASKLANKNFLESIIKSNPYSKSVVLLSLTTPASGDISLYYGDRETLGNAIITNVVANFGTINRVNDTFPLVGSATVNYPPIATTNYSGAAAVIDAAMLTNLTAFPGRVMALGALNGTPASSINTTNMIYSDAHRALRALHMKAGGATTDVGIVKGKAPAPVLTFGTLIAPVAAVAPAFSTTFAPGLLGAPGERGTLGLAIGFIFDPATTMTKIGKTTALTNKNFDGIIQFFTGTTPFTNSAAAVAKKSLIVPCTRTPNGAITLSATGTSTVAITAVVVPAMPQSLSFYVSDPNYPNKTGFGYYSVNNANPNIASALYNYAGTLVGVTAP